MNSTSDELELWLRIVHGAVGSLLLLCSIFCSCTVLLLVTCNRKLRYPSIVISLGLVVADLVVAIAWLFTLLAHVATGDWSLGDGVCTAFGAILVWMLYVRWSEVAVVTADRFLIVVFPFFTYKKYSKPLMITMTVLAWLVPATLTVIPGAHGFGRIMFRPQLSACSVDCEGDGPCTSFYIALFGLYLIIGGVLPAVLYTSMYCIGLRKRWKYKNRQLGTITGPQEFSSSSNSSGYITEDLEGPSLNSDLNHSGLHAHNTQSPSTRRRSKLFLKPRDRRALATIFIIFISMLLTHIPIYIFSSIRSVGDIYESTPLIVHFISLYIFFLGPILDSVIIMRNKDFRDIFTNALRKQKIRPIAYSTGRRNSIVLLLSVGGGRRNSSASQTNCPGNINKNMSENSTHLGSSGARQENLDMIVEESSTATSHAVNVVEQDSTDGSRCQYITEV